MSQRTIFIYPAKLSGNRYLEFQVRALNQVCDDVRPLSAKQLLQNRLNLDRESIVVLNFFEDRMGYHKTKPITTFVQNLLILVLLRVLCKKLIWVRHNLWPHDLPRGDVKQAILLKVMAALTDVIVTHRQVDGIASRVVPHPLYFEEELPASDRDIDYLFFGIIKRYKGIDSLLAIWPRDRRLLVAGFAPDKAVFDELREIARLRDIDVEFIEGFLPDEDLDSILLRTKYAIFPHRDDTMIVAGSFYHAASFGCNVVSRVGDFSAYLKTEFSFVNLFEDRTLEGVLSNVYYVEASAVVEELKTSNGVSACRMAWESILA